MSMVYTFKYVHVTKAHWSPFGIDNSFEKPNAIFYTNQINVNMHEKKIDQATK